MCGWERVNGALVEKNTGASGAELGKLGRRRQELLRIPCYYCGGKSENLDHVIPRSRGGAGAGNKVASCIRCNCMKSNMLYEEFIEQCRKILAWHESRMRAHAARDAANAPVA